jgi:chromate transport protein ChrA
MRTPPCTGTSNASLRGLSRTATRPWFGEATRAWVRVALLSFGGPAAQFAVMHRILVADKCWVDERRFPHALNFCML